MIDLEVSTFTDFSLINLFIEARLTSVQRVKQWLKGSFQSIRFFNLYKSNEGEANNISLQLKYTRIYLVLLISSLLVILFFTVIIQHSATVITPYPDLKDYEYLMTLHLDNVDCPCTHIAIPYEKIITELNVTSFHEVCSSKKLSKIVELGLPKGGIFNTGHYNFDNWHNYFIRGLYQLCTIAQQIVDDGLLTFLSSTMLVYRMIPRKTFDEEMNTILIRFKNTLPIALNQTLDLIRAVGHDNALIQGIPPNWNIFLEDDNTSFVIESVTHNLTDANRTCSCATDRDCVVPVTVYDRAEWILVNSPAGVVFGCAMIESILRSSLFCFYQSQCVAEYWTLYQRPDIPWSTYKQVAQYILNTSLTRFSINDTIETLLQSLFIESWSSHISYEKFFESCAPTQCRSTYFYRFDLFQIFTTFLSVCAALPIILRFLVPYLFSVIAKLRSCAHVPPLNTSRSPQ